MSEPRPYVSPFPVVLGHRTKRRYHQFGATHCVPEMCRECYREAHWTEGQTHG